MIDLSKSVDIELDFKNRGADPHAPISVILDTMAALEKLRLAWLAEEMGGTREEGIQSFGHILPAKIGGAPYPVILHRAWGPHSTTNLSFGGQNGSPAFNAFSGGRRTHIYTVVTDVIVGPYTVESTDSLTNFCADLVEIFDRHYCANQYLGGICNYAALVPGHTVERIPYGGDLWFGTRLRIEVSADYVERGPGFFNA
jgi:hypothetical protein